jgi:hypothetical protein
MSIVRGLKNINKAIEAEEAKFSGGDRAKTVWFTLKDKQSAKILFLQELDEDSENFSAKNDLGVMAVEHVNPKNWQRKAVCTEPQCYGCEQHQKDFKAGWRQKQRLYINVLVDDGQNEPYVAVLSQGMSGASITPTLFEYAAEGSITNQWFKIKRMGEKKDTSWLLMPGPDASDVNVEDYTLFDISKDVLRNVEYEKQEAHYNYGLDPEPEASAAPAFAGASASTGDQDW